MKKTALGLREWYRLAIVASLVIICVLATYWFHFALKVEIVFTHLFYVPIILAGLWWSRKGAFVGVFLAIMLLISHLLSPLETPAGADVARATMFVVVGTVVGILTERRVVLEDRLREYSNTLEQRVEEQTRQVREAQERERAVLDGIGDAVVVLDDHLNITWANPIALEQYGAILGKKCYQAYRSVEQPCAHCVARRTLADGVVRSSEEQGILKEGNPISFTVTCSPVRDADGEIVSVVEVLHDITERVRAEKELRKVNRALRVLSECNQAVVRATAESDLLHDVCQIMVQVGGYRLAWVGFAEEDEEKTVRLAAQMGYEEGYLDTVNITWADNERGRGPTGTAIRTGKPSTCKNILTDPRYASWRTGATERGYASSIALPLIANGRALGALNIYAPEPDAFDADEVELLTELADDLAFGIMALRTRTERDRADQAHREYSERLDLLVDIALSISSAPDLGTLLDRLIRRLVEAIAAADMGAIYVYDPEMQMLIPGACVGYDSGAFSQIRLRLGESISGKVFQRRRSSLTRSRQEADAVRGDLQPENTRLFRLARGGLGVLSNICVPLGTRTGEGIGTLTLGSTHAAFSHDDLSLLESVAVEVAMAIQNSRLHEQVQHHAAELEQRVIQRTQDLAIARERAEQADRVKSIFLASMSHELRTPLNSIIGFTGIMLQGLAGPLNAEQSKQLNMVRDSSRHLLNLINDVLDISRIEAGQLEIVAEPFDMRVVIDEAVRAVSPLAAKKGLALLTRVAPEVGQIVSDRRRVRQILINLLNNAVKFTDEGQVRVESQVRDGWLVTDVVDTGIGIRREDMGKLFEAFQQIETGRTRQHEGTGLGLSICKRLTQMLGGEISVESDWGLGSTFTFRVPIAAGGTHETDDTRHRG